MAKRGGALDKPRKQPRLNLCVWRVAARVHFHYIKSHAFRVVHGGWRYMVALRQMAAVSTWQCSTTRIPIAQEEIYSISSEGRLGALKSKTGRQGIVREG